jgi:hypothetical protein
MNSEPLITLQFRNLEESKRFLEFLKLKLQTEVLPQNERSSLELAITLLEDLIQEKINERGD